MSALIATEGKTFDLIFNERIKLFSVDKLLKELEKHKPEVLKKLDYLSMILMYF